MLLSDRRLIFFCASFLIGLSQPAFARLEWSTKEVMQTAEPNATSVTVTFPFTNTGETPVTIQEVKPSCGCTTVALKQKTYAPGESGEIEARLHVGDRQGLQVKTIEVATDEADHARTRLTMKTRIPQILEIKPAFVFWKRGAAPTPATITLEAHTDAPLRIIEVSSAEPGLKTELKTLEDGRSYVLEITPLSTEKPLQALLTLKTDYPAAAPKSFTVYAHIK